MVARGTVLREGYWHVQKNGSKEKSVRVEMGKRERNGSTPLDDVIMVCSNLRKEVHKGSVSTENLTYRAKEK